MKVLRASDMTQGEREYLKQSVPHVEDLFWNVHWHPQAVRIAQKVLEACRLNMRNHGEPYCWLNSSTTEIEEGLVIKPDGLRMLIDAGYVHIEDAPERQTPPPYTVFKEKNPQVIRVTDQLLACLRSEPIAASA